MKKKAVGRSSRTPLKHDILNDCLGQIVGTLALQSPKVPAIASSTIPFVGIDMCAGDADPKYENSPSLFLHHAKHLTKHRIGTQIYLIEKSPATYDILRSNIDDANVRILNGDARDYMLAPQHKRQACFINADPNHIKDMPMSENFARSMTPATTLIMTLGCNVGGLKRLPIEERMPWFDYLRIQLNVMPHWHDAILARLLGDASMWAYFIRIPAAWSSGTVKKIKKRGESYGTGIDVASINDNPDHFNRLAQQLFLTKKELGK